MNVAFNLRIEAKFSANFVYKGRDKMISGVWVQTKIQQILKNTAFMISLHIQPVKICNWEKRHKMNGRLVGLQPLVNHRVELLAPVHLQIYDRLFKSE